MLVQLLHVLVKQGGEAVAAYASEVVSMLEVTLGDSYYEVNMEACAAVESLTGVFAGGGG